MASKQAQKTLEQIAQSARVLLPSGWTVNVSSFENRLTFVSPVGMRHNAAHEIAAALPNVKVRFTAQDGDRAISYAYGFNK